MEICQQPESFAEWIKEAIDDKSDEWEHLQ